MSDTSKQLPYETLGSELKRFRERSSESVAEVSGAVEIDEKALARIEAGKDRPSEDILLLLISHFDIKDDTAAELWQMAGYDKARDDDKEMPDTHGLGEQTRTQTMMVMIDPRVMYSDAVEIVANKEGVVVNFSQTTGPNGQPLTVSRIGMSRDQAKMVMGILHQALYDIENPGNRNRLGDGSDR